MEYSFNFSGIKKRPSLSKFVGTISENIEVAKSSWSSENMSSWSIWLAILLILSELHPSIEGNLKDYLGVNKIIWLKNGTDEGTDGHVDNIACFAAPGKILALSCSDKQDTFYDKINENLEILKTSVNSKGNVLDIIELEMSYKRLIPNDDEPSSYINFYIANKGIVMPSFDDEKADIRAKNIIQSAFPDRKIITINGIDISMGGGNVHCITQQQPMSL